MEYDEPYFAPRNNEADDYFGKAAWTRNFQDSTPRSVDRSQLFREDSGYHSGRVISPQQDVMLEEYRRREKRIDFEDSECGAKSAWLSREKEKNQRVNDIPPSRRQSTVRPVVPSRTSTSHRQPRQDSDSNHLSRNREQRDDTNYTHEPDEVEDDDDRIQSMPRRTKTWATSSNSPYEERMRRTPTVVAKYGVFVKEKGRPLEPISDSSL
jgi:hypothetical protein